MSPTAQRPGACGQDKLAETGIDRSRNLSTPSTMAVSGITPVPSTTKSAFTTLPSPSSTPVALAGSFLVAAEPLICATLAPPINFTLFFSTRGKNDPPICFPSTRSNGTSSMAITVTSKPLRASDEATSMPMNDAPTITTFFARLCDIFQHQIVWDIANSDHIVEVHPREWWPDGFPSCRNDHIIIMDHFTTNCHSLGNGINL
mmetsp:Transcript_51223/g.109697  ORF Transcript_51223/g.109697 Transcript_51223/m.109697 type:complete len:203 (+) Transcript_51223:456-1064(+)